MFPTVCQVMEKISNVAVLIKHSSTAASSSPSALESLSQTQQAVKVDPSQSFQQKQAADSLIQVIEKLSKIVERRPQHQFTLVGQKRAIQQASPTGGGEGSMEEKRGSRGGSPCKKIKRNCKEESAEEGRLDNSALDAALTAPVSSDSNNNNNSNVISAVTEEAGNPNGATHKRTVTCYQCSLCPYLSQTLPLLKEHLKQHNEQHTDLILMCSKCHFTSRDQAELEAHVGQHLNNDDDPKWNSAQSGAHGEVADEVSRKQDGDAQGSGGTVDVEGSKQLPEKKKWYSYEEYGLYRCLICSYVCSQQRMLKTHAWKHAGLVDCSYPIFEDEDGTATRKEALAATNTTGTAEKIVVLSPVLQDKSLQKLPTAFKLQLFAAPVAAENKQDLLTPSISNLTQSPKIAEEEESVYPMKHLTSEEPAVEVQVKTEAESEVDPDSTSAADSLLSSAQKIINSSPNSAGHINVIVERLPSAEDPVMATNPLLLSPDVDGDKSLLYAKEGEQHHVAAVKDELVPGCSAASTTDSQPVGTNLKSSVSINSDSPRDENIPPAGRKRTHSESLRLHSLAAEALVAMPMRTPELPSSSAKVSLKTITAQAQSQTSGQKLVEVTTPGQTSDIGTTAALLDLELHNKGREEDLGSLGLGEGDEEGPATKAGISLSLLAVIERLRERSDQNASDEDILKELQDNAQFQNGAVAGVVTGNGAASYMCSIPGMDGLVASPDGGLVDYIPGSDRPFRCRLCRYSSGNKGYIKQHLRVHRQRQPYQCPICEHIASDSKDLESHMIHHCKTRTYQCKLCSDTFHYKVRTHHCPSAAFCFV